jgi:alpha-beta hydrolase superfamily lysophospholipase
VPEARSSASGKVPARYPALGAASWCVVAPRQEPGTYLLVGRASTKRGRAARLAFALGARGFQLLGLRKRKMKTQGKTNDPGA